MKFKILVGDKIKFPGDVINHLNELILENQWDWIRAQNRLRSGSFDKPELKERKKKRKSRTRYCRLLKRSVV